ncbi:MAG: hydroxymethylbilane synthase, partial [Paracoccaceae bacterium]
CETPIAGLAEFTPKGLRLRGEILRPDGSQALIGERSGAIADGAAMGRDLAKDLLSQGGPGFFDWRAP